MSFRWLNRWFLTPSQTCVGCMYRGDIFRSIRSKRLKRTLILIGQHKKSNREAGTLNDILPVSLLLEKKGLPKNMRAFFFFFF